MFIKNIQDLNTLETLVLWHWVNMKMFFQMSLVSRVFNVWEVQKSLKVFHMKFGLILWTSFLSRQHLNISEDMLNFPASLPSTNEKVNVKSYL